MEIIKLLPTKDRPKDYLVWTCPNCGRTRFSISSNPGSKLGKTLYRCDIGRVGHWENGFTKFIIEDEGCGGLSPQMVNPKYM